MYLKYKHFVALIFCLDELSESIKVIQLENKNTDIALGLNEATSRFIGEGAFVQFKANLIVLWTQIVKTKLAKLQNNPAGIKKTLCGFPVCLQEYFVYVRGFFISLQGHKKSPIQGSNFVSPCGYKKSRKGYSISAWGIFGS